MIETFEELFEEVKKLYNNDRNLIKYSEFRFGIPEKCYNNFEIKHFKSIGSATFFKERNWYHLLSRKPNVINISSNNPQKIFNVLKAIKECSEDD
ncbi:MAG: hypothetical protein BV456_00895 [Thermoplasmata archaeon M8B2D]|nr:MAG: hypothetical protein BV456_00895 [Thermoplasmata archaeon M8B2D]